MSPLHRVLQLGEIIVKRSVQVPCSMRFESDLLLHPHFTVASLQRLKLESLISALADCKIRSVIKFLNVEIIAPKENHRQLCQVYGHTRLDGPNNSCRSSAGRCLLIIHPDLAPYDFHLFLQLKIFLSGQCQRFQNDREAEMSVTQWFQSQAADFYNTGYKSWSYGMTCLNSGGEYVEK